MRLGLHRRVLLYLLLAALASCVLTVGVGVVLVRHRVSAARLATLERQANDIAALGAAPGAFAAGQHVYRVGAGRAHLVGPRGAAVILATIPQGGSAQGSFTVNGTSFLYAARPTGVGRIVLVRSDNLPFAEWRPFLLSLLLAGLGGAVLALVLSYLLARRLTRPIDELSEATRRLAIGEPGVSVPAGGDDELADLGRAFNDMSEQLVRAGESQRQFLESVSHELKTPLTSIRGYAEAIEESAVAPSDGARVIATEAGRLERLVFDLLDLARVERSGFAVEREPVDLAVVAAEAVERYLPKAREMAVTLSARSTEEAWALGDRERILQAISNLIENALRMTPPGGQVLIRVEPGAIVVSDTGPGLAEEDLPRAFERFYLRDRYRGERPVGSGLGLAIVKEVIGAMGGSVQASTPPDGGAQFWLTLPTPGRSALPGAARPSA